MLGSICCVCDPVSTPMKKMKRDKGRGIERGERAQQETEAAL